MPLRSRRTAVFALGCVLLGVSFDRLSANPVSRELPVRTGETAGADDDHTDYVRRALSPSHPANVDGLHLAATGTGFFVAPSVLLTNFHVAGRCRALTVGNNTEGEELGAALLRGDEAADLAILSADDPSAKPAQFKVALDQETGTGLAIIGYPEHGLPVLQAELSEVVASPDDLLGNRPGFPFGGVVRRGNSGGPVLDGSGAVLGMVRAKIDTPAMYRATGDVVDNVGFAISNSTILGFLRANRIAIGLTPQQASLPPDQLLQKAHDFVRQVGCWN